MVTPRHRILLEGVTRVRELRDLVSVDTEAAFALLRAWRQGAELPIPIERKAQFNVIVRMVIRAYFAEVEAISFGLRDCALTFHKEGILKLSLGEELLLRERTYSISKHTPRAQKRFLRLMDGLSLGYSIFMRAFGIAGEIDRHSPEWPSFKRAVDLRNSVTHPKGPSDYQLPKDALTALASALSWFTKQQDFLLTECFKVLKEPITK
jgi:hypothetical protein